MDTIFINSKNSKTSDPHRLLLNLLDKTNLKREDKYVALSSLSIYYAWKNIKKSAWTWYNEIELSDVSYSVSYFQDHFEYILQKTWRKDW